jgi:hypothetical protein
MDLCCTFCNLVAVLEHPLPDVHTPRPNSQPHRREESTRIGDTVCTDQPCAREEPIWVGGDGDSSGFRGAERRRVFCEYTRSIIQVHICRC